MPWRIPDPSQYRRVLLQSLLRLAWLCSLCFLAFLILRSLRLFKLDLLWPETVDNGFWIAVIAFVWPGFSYILRKFRIHPEVDSVLGARLPVAWAETANDQALIPPRCLNARDAIDASRIEKIIKRHYRKTVHNFYWLLAICEPECGSRNFVVRELYPKHKFCFRLHSRVKDDSVLERLQAIESRIATSKVFAEFSRYLQALPPDRREFNKSFVRYDKETLAAVYPFLDDVERFDCSERQFYSLAERYGALQSVIEYECDGEVDNEHDWVNISLQSVEDFIKAATGQILSGHKSTVQVSQLLRANKDLILECVRRSMPIYNKLRSRAIADRKFVLHDLHPLNAFFKDASCVLIYDYECVTKNVSEEEAAAFAFHRFARKILINRQDLQQASDQGTNQYLLNSAQEFMDSYNRGRMIPRLNRPVRQSPALTQDNFIKVLDILVMIPNLQKILYVGGPAFRGERDPAGRSLQVLYAELVKYISCLLEARQIQSVP